MITLYTLLSIFMAWSTYRLIKRPNISPTRASALVSLLTFLFLYGLHQVYTFDLYFFSSLAFGASFVGMCSHKIIGDNEVILGAAFFNRLYIYAIPHFSHLGGALGFSAFIGVMASRLTYQAAARISS